MQIKRQTVCISYSGFVLKWRNSQKASVQSDQTHSLIAAILCLSWNAFYIEKVLSSITFIGNFTVLGFTSLCGSMMTVTLLPVTWASTCRECMACFLTVELGEVTSRTRSCVTIWKDLSWAARSSSVFSSSFSGVAQRTSNCSRVVLAMATAPFDTLLQKSIR